jgi:hypothetical protein
MGRSAHIQAQLSYDGEPHTGSSGAKLTHYQIAGLIPKRTGGGLYAVRPAIDVARGPILGRSVAAVTVVTLKLATPSKGCRAEGPGATFRPRTKPAKTPAFPV